MFTFRRPSHALQAIATLVIFSPLVAAGWPTAEATAQQNCRKISNYDVCGRFLEEWSKQGSEQANVYVNGLPITGRRSEVSLTDGKNYDMQWFERARFEAHPENSAPYDVLFGLLGVSLTEGRGAIDIYTRKAKNPADAAFAPVDKPAGANVTTKVWFPETKHTVSGKILEYWNRYGALKQFGFPVSEQFDELSATDGKTYQVQYFERNRFELHPEKAAPYEVELGLLGVQQYATQAIAGDKLPIAPPPGQISTRENATLAFSQEPAGLNDLTGTTLVARTLMDALDDGLVGQDNQGEFYPEDALYVPTLENGGSYYVGAGVDRHLVTKYKIRRGIKWSDGVELTSKDAAFSFKLILNPDTGYPDNTRWRKVFGVETPDKYTVVYNWLSYQQANDLYSKTADKDRVYYLKSFIDGKLSVSDPLYMAVGTIHPEHLLAAVSPAALDENPYSHEGHVGTGPFKIGKWNVGHDIDLVQNENYSLTSKPPLKRIFVRFISDPTQLYTLLKTGDLDGVSGDAFTVPTEGLDQLGPSQRIEYTPGRRSERLDLNFKFAPFGDRAVREAIITGINRQKIIDLTLRGKAQIPTVAVPPASPYSMQNPNLAKRWGDKYPPANYAYDPNRANGLLDAAGWVRGADGIRAKGDQRLQLDLVVAGSNKQRETAASEIQTGLKALGIGVTVKKTGYYCQECQPQPCQLCAVPDVLGEDPDLSLWSTERAAADENARGALLQYRRFSNADLDPLLKQFSSELERGKREQAAAQIQQKLSQEIALVPLFVRPIIEVHKVNLSGWKASDGQTTTFYNVAQWYFK